jgi:hypothetical protein
MTNLTACCGLKCAECPAFIATKNNDDALRAKTAAEWTVKHSHPFTPDMINCAGCKTDGVKIGFCSFCEVRKCVTGKELDSCKSCGEVRTCKIIGGFIEMFPDMQANLF